MPVHYALRTPTDEERDYVEARRTQYGGRQVPSHQPLILGVLGSALAAVATYALTCGRQLWLAAFVFAVGATVMAIRHYRNLQAAAGTPTRWDPPAGGWQIAEWHVQASSVAEVGDADGTGGDWLLFKVSDRMAFMVALLDINFEAVGPAPSLQAIATEDLVLNRLWPNGPWLPALPSGKPIPVHSFRIEERTWSPPDGHDLASFQIGLEELPDWLREALV